MALRCRGSVTGNRLARPERLHRTVTVDLDTSEKFEFYLPAGDHVLGAKPNGICGGGTSGVEVVIAENRTKVYRVSIGQGGDIHIQPSAF